MKTARGITKTPMLKSRLAMSLEPIFLFSFPKTGGTAELGNDNNFDFYLGADNTDLGISGAKSVIIPAATAAATEWTVSVPIDIWDDDIVEATLTAENENFSCKSMDIRTKELMESGQPLMITMLMSAQIIFLVVTIQDNDLPPSAFTVGAVITKTTNAEDVVSGHWNPITVDTGILTIQV